MHAVCQSHEPVDQRRWRETSFSTMNLMAAVAGMCNADLKDHVQICVADESGMRLGPSLWQHCGSVDDEFAKEEVLQGAE